MKKILVPLDGSDISVKAAEGAVALAKTCGGTVTFLMVVEAKSEAFYADLGGIVSDEYFGILENLIQVKKQRDSAVLDQIVGSLDTEGIETEKKVLIGDAHEQIVETAEKGAYDLIILGHRGLNPVKRFFMGSTAKKVMEDAPCSVMIVK